MLVDPSRGLGPVWPLYLTGSHWVHAHMWHHCCHTANSVVVESSGVDSPELERQYLKEYSLRVRGLSRNFRKGEGVQIFGHTHWSEELYIKKDVCQK